MSSASAAAAAAKKVLLDALAAAALEQAALVLADEDSAPILVGLAAPKPVLLDALAAQALEQALDLIKSGASDDEILGPLFGNANSITASVSSEIIGGSSQGTADVAAEFELPLVWVAERDACLDCLAYSGQWIDTGEDWPEGLTYGANPAPEGAVQDGPPMHPNCRCHTEPLQDTGYADALRREADRSVLRGYALPSESEASRLRAADRLIQKGVDAPKSVIKFAEDAIKRGSFPTQEFPAGVQTLSDALKTGEATSYRGQHTAPDHLFGAPINDLTSTGMYPADVYGDTSNHLYTASAAERRAMAVAKSYHGADKNDLLTVYRAIPKGEAQVIHPGDWVAITKEYAAQHGESVLNGEFVIVSKKVPLGSIWTNGDSIAEWGYDPVAMIFHASTPAEAIGYFADAHPQVEVRGFRFTNIAPVTNETLGTLSNLVDKFPSAPLDSVTVGDLNQAAKGTRALGMTWANHDPNSSYKFMPYVSLDKQFLQQAAQGVIPGGGLQTPAYVMSHEFGHVMDHATGDILEGKMTDVIAAAMHSDGVPSHDIVEWMDLVSGTGELSDWMVPKSVMDWTSANMTAYATASPAETIAEAFADVEINGAAARPFSKSLYDLLTNMYDARYGAAK